MLSGGLGYRVLKHICNPIDRIEAVFTDRQSIAIIEFCKKSDIPLFIGNPRNGKAASFIKNIQCDILLSINYLFIIEKDLIGWPAQYAINLHGSLLPKYRGRTPHVWAIINGETETGVTAHLIDTEVDCGDILKQIKIPISFNDTGNDVLKKFAIYYPQVIDQIIEDISNNMIMFLPQDHSKATYFGKRTPGDGHINWSWNRDRIRNWVRAQARPYPGAFAFLDGVKLIINKAEFSELGFHYEQPNGSVLDYNADKITVKTPNGALDLLDIDFDRSLRIIEKGKVLK